MVVPSWLGDTFLLQRAYQRGFFYLSEKKGVIPHPCGKILSCSRRTGDNVLNLTPRPTDAAGG
ncbi:MAG: hypothetical protein MIK86_24390, partial [Klebsiella quasipneumoniae]